MHAEPEQPVNEDGDRSKEWRLFIFIVVFLFPILSVMIVGGFGFLVWMYQIIAGPPGPPAVH